VNPAGISEDAWLGERLGKPAWHLAPEADPAVWRTAVSAPAFADTRLAADDTGRHAVFLQAGFEQVDTTVTFERPGDAATALQGSSARPAAPGDLNAVRAIAGTNFITDRFHADARIDDAIADRIKADWAGNFFAGQRGDWMVVAENEGRVVGFLQLLDWDCHLVIDLIAVDHAARGKGLAAAMIEYAATNLMPGAPMRVGTQIANTGSVRLYETLGFRLVRTEHVLHCHHH